MSSKRRVKNVDYYEDEDDDYYDDYDYDDYPKPAPPVKPKAAPKPSTKAAVTKSTAKPPPKPKSPSSSKPVCSSFSSASPKYETVNDNQLLPSASSPTSLPPAPSCQSKTDKSLPPPPTSSLSTPPSGISTDKDETPFDSAEDGKPSLNLVVVGHVDSGKSTLMGHLLLKMGAVTSRQMHKYETEAKNIGKASFAYAWILDEGKDERERGVTIDVCVKYFSTESKNVVVLDAPGHQDFVPAMLSAAVQADVAILVVDASNFEAGFIRGGQTKEHIQLVRALGISHLIVAINKLDIYNWDESRYTYLVDELKSFILGPEIRFKPSNVQYIPVSAFQGVNIVGGDDLASCPALCSWWTSGESIISAVDGVSLPSSFSSTSGDGGKGDMLKTCVSDVWKAGSSASVALKVDHGVLSVGQQVVILPSREPATVKNIQCRNRSVKSAHTGEYVESVTLSVDVLKVHIGAVLCVPNKLLPVVSEFYVQLIILDVPMPIVKGQQLMSYIHTSVQPATIIKIEATLNKSTGKKDAKKPRVLIKGDMAILQLKVPQTVCVEYKQQGMPSQGSNKQPDSALSRVILRDRGRTIAAGLIIDPVTATAPPPKTC